MTAIPETPKDGGHHLVNALETSIRIGLIALIVVWCFSIVRPFIVPLAWAIIIAVASYPLYLRLETALKGHRWLAATVVTLMVLVLLLIPVLLLTETLVDEIQSLAAALEQGRVEIPPPPEHLRTWPLIGGWLDQFWSLASHNAHAAITSVEPQLKSMGTRALSSAVRSAFGLVQFLAAILIAGVLLANTKRVYGFVHDLAYRVAGDKGRDVGRIAEETIRSVTRGILGVALIQSILAGIGFLVVGIPAAGLWAMLCLLLSVIQIGPLPILLPAVIYAFVTDNILTAVVFLVWCLFVGLLDNVLKPIVFSHGVEVPMWVIFVGSIGGMITAGIIGLFVGSVVLAIGYKLFMSWFSYVPPDTGARIAREEPGPR